MEGEKRVQSDVAELNWTGVWHGLVFDELTNEQAVLHYSTHRLTASVTTWLRTRIRQPMSDGLALLSHLNHWSVCQKT